jgi:hypothetical protein
MSTNIRFACICAEDAHSKVNRCDTCGDIPRLMESGVWTCPEGYRYVECSGCSVRFITQKPQKSIGGASVEGSLCTWCKHALQTEDLL